ncbi:hypothetical protein LGAA44_120149 [Leuconostoc gasicomitatum]|nr:hypothetical protein LGAA44_120149 [Leuconostoc gasicomitatum]
MYLLAYAYGNHILFDQNRHLFEFLIDKLASFLLHLFKLFRTDSAD